MLKVLKKVTEPNIGLNTWILIHGNLGLPDMINGWIPKTELQQTLSPGRFVQKKSDASESSDLGHLKVKTELSMETDQHSMKLVQQGS